MRLILPLLCFLISPILVRSQYVITNELLESEQISYQDLAQEFFYFCSRECPTARLTGETSIAREKVEQFWRAGIAEFTRQTKIVLPELAIETTDQNAATLENTTEEELVRFVSSITSRSETFDDIVVYISSKTRPISGVYLSNGVLLVILDVEIIEKGRTNALVHLFSNLLGLPPLWGSKGYCSDDGINDTPIHSGVNTDCASSHYTTCYGNQLVSELKMNYMDGRMCDANYSFTNGQLEFLELASKGLEIQSCPERKKQLEEGECGLTIRTSQLSKSQTKVFYSIDSSHESDIVVSLSNSTGLMMLSQTLSASELDRSRQEVEIMNLNMKPGLYTLTLRTKKSICSKNLIISE